MAPERVRVGYWLPIVVIGAVIVLAWLAIRGPESVGPATQPSATAARDAGETAAAGNAAAALAPIVAPDPAPDVTPDIGVDGGDNRATPTNPSALVRVPPTQLIAEFNREERDAGWATLEEAALYQRIGQAAPGLKLISVQAECRRTICRLEAISATEASMRDSGLSVLWATDTLTAVPTHTLFGGADGVPSVIVYQQRRLLETPENAR
jgi:hypothetical protein